jgi:seryl-tRNA synthetase
MHDIKLLRENPEAFDAGLAKRGLPPQAHTILALDAQARAATTLLQEQLARRNEASKAIGAAKAAKDETKAQALMEEVASLKERLPVLETEAAALQEQLNAPLHSLPNLPAEDVPLGADEQGNLVVKTWGEPRELPHAREHFDIGAPLGLDFESAQDVAGARFAYLRGGMARLHRALAQFMLDTHTQKLGYEEVNTPVLVRDAALFGTAQLPKFADDLFRTTDDRWLIPTAEVSLTNLVREKIVSETDLPLRFTAHSLCFRSEAGSAGKDTRGLIRQHQFEKVELVSIATPEQSDAEHEHMTQAAEHILEALELPYRRMLLCSGDMGFSARKTFDLEVWLPGQNCYREISSCSNCGDFQARRMNARFRAEGEKATRFLHTLNGSGLAVGRTLVAVLENYQQADGSVTIPKVLQPYMGGMDVLKP